MRGRRLTERPRRGKRPTAPAPRDLPPQNLKRPLLLIAAPACPGRNPREGSWAGEAEGCNSTGGAWLGGRPTALVVALAATRAEAARCKETARMEGGMAGHGVPVLLASCEASDGDVLLPGTRAMPLGIRQATGTERATRETSGPGEKGEARKAAQAATPSPPERGGERTRAVSSLWASATPIGVGRESGTTCGMRRGMPMWRPLSGCSPRNRRSRVRAREYGKAPSADFRPRGKPWSHSARSRRGKWHKYPAH